jgi:hypothetical protein
MLQALCVFMSEDYTEEQKARLDELKRRAEKLGYALRQNPRDPLWLGLISRHPEYLDESERPLHPFYSLDDLEKVISAEESLPETQGCWTLKISSNSSERPYESRTFAVVIEVPAKRDAQAQSVACEQSVEYVAEKRGATPRNATMTGPPRKVAKPSEDPAGKTSKGFSIWASEET